MINSCLPSNAHDLLNRPVWAALSTRLSHLAVTYGQARTIPPEFGPFVATPSAEAGSMRDFAALVSGMSERILSG